MNDAFSTEFENRVEDLAACLKKVEGSALHARLTERQTNALFLVIDEMVSNVIKYAGRDGVKVRLGLSLDDGVLTIRLDDDGPAFNPWGMPPPLDAGPVDALPIGGRGIHIVRQATDSRTHQHVDGWNRLVMTVNPA